MSGASAETVVPDDSEPAEQGPPELKENLSNIDDKTHENLAVLSRQIEQKEKLAKKNDVSHELDSEINKFSISNKWGIESAFSDYTDALNDYYLLTEPGFYIPIAKPKLNIDAYQRNSERFRNLIEEKTDNRLDYLLGKKDTTKETLANFKKEIEAEYSYYANLDNKPGTIDAIDLYKIQEMALSSVGSFSQIENNTNEQVMRMLEAAHLINPKALKKSAENMAENIEIDAVNNGSHDAFIEAANSLRKKEGKEPVSSLRKARRYFENSLSEANKAGAHETIAIIEHFNNAVNKGRSEILKSIPSSLKSLVYDERKMLVKRRMFPENETESAIVEFMSTGRKGRENILKNPDYLFKAIQNVKAHYSEIYTDEYADSIPDDAGEMTSNRKNREKPTFYDRAARLQAMIMLAKEAELIVQNYSKTDSERKHLLTELEETKADDNRIIPGLNFKDVSISHVVPYKSALSRGGFNGADLGIKVAKIAASFVVVFNLANSIKNADGDGVLEKIINGAENSLTNPALLAGVGVAVGAHAVEMYPELKNYPWASEYGQKGITTGIGLEMLGQKVGTNRVKALIGNRSEWDVMEYLESEEIEIRDLLEKARERNPNHPLISNEDLRGLIPDTNVTSELPGGRKHESVRFLFYQKFLSSEKKPNINQLREICQRS